MIRSPNKSKIEKDNSEEMHAVVTVGKLKKHTLPNVHMNGDVEEEIGSESNFFILMTPLREKGI